MSWKKLNEKTRELNTRMGEISQMQVDAKSMSQDEFMERHGDSSTFIKAVEWAIRLFTFAMAIPVFGRTTRAILSLLIAFCEGVLLKGKIHD